MDKKKISFKRKVIRVLSKLMLFVGIIVAFYKLPSILAEKICYWKLKKKEIKQDLNEEE